MPAFGPVPEVLPYPVIHRLERLGRTDVPVVHRPSVDYWIKRADQVYLFGCPVNGHCTLYLLQKRRNALGRWLDDQLPVVLAEVLAEEVEAFTDMHDARFLW